MVWRCGFWGVVAIALAGACASKNTHFCETPVQCDDPSAPWCDIDGVQAGRLNTCIRAPGPKACNAAEVCAVGPCENNVCRDYCTSVSDCRPELPVCEASACVACAPGIAGDLLCETNYPNQPFCAVEGTCSECLSDSDCPDAALSCDRGICIACNEHTDCNSGICNRITNACANSDNIAHAAPDGSGTSCTIGDECSVEDAIASNKLWVKLESGTYSIAQETSLRIEEPTYLVGPSTPGTANAAVLKSNTDHQTFLVIAPTGELWLDQIEFVLPGHVAVDCDSPAAPFGLFMFRVSVSGFNLNSVELSGCDARFDETSITNSNGSGIYATQNSSIELLRSTLQSNGNAGLASINSPLFVRQSSIVGNGQGGLMIADSSFDIENSVVANNNATGIKIVNSIENDPQRIDHCTIANNVDSDDTSGVYCDLSGWHSFTNSIVYSDTPTQPAVTGACTWTYSIIKDGSGGAILSTGTTSGAPLLSSTHRLTSTSTTAIDLANGNIVDMDIDGDARPQGIASDIGADEYVP